MRLSILGNGGGSVGQLQTNVGTLHDKINDTIDALKRVSVKLDHVPGGSGGLDNAGSKLRERINAEENKLESVKTTAAKIDTFLENAIETDRQVGEMIRENQEQFFEENPWLCPVETEEKSWWEKLIENLKDFMKATGEKIKEALAGLWAWVQEHAVELIVGTIAIIIGALITVFLGELTLAAFLGALLVGFKIALISALVDAAISGIFALITGEDFWSAFGDGFADGYMWSGLLQMFNGLRKVIPALDNIVNSISAGFNKLMSKLKSFLDDFVRGVKNTFSTVGNKIKTGFPKLIDDIGEKIIKPMRTKIDDVFAKLKRKFADFRRRITRYNPPGPDDVKLPDKKIQKKYKHAKAYGITDNWNKANGERFADAVRDHIANAPEKYITDYHNADAYMFFDPATNLATFVDLDGNFISGWILNDDQVKHYTSIVGVIIK